MKSLVATIQMCSSNVIDDNLLTAANLIKEAADQGAQLVVLPEMFAMIGTSAQDKILRDPLKNSWIKTL